MIVSRQDAKAQSTASYSEIFNVFTCSQRFRDFQEINYPVSSGVGVPARPVNRIFMCGAVLQVEEPLKCLLSTNLYYRFEMKRK